VSYGYICSWTYACDMVIFIYHFSLIFINDSWTYACDMVNIVN
jgi:hypothetical protein